jgi:aminopeptidase
MAALDADPRWAEVGRVLVQHSTKVQPGERVMIAMSEVDSYPLARGVFEACIAAGGYPQVQFLSEELRHAILARGNDDQLAWVPEIEAYGMQWADVYIALRGAFDLDVHADVPSERLAVNQAAQGKVSTLRWQNTRWSLVRVPNQAFADQAGVSLEKVTEMFFSGCLLDWGSAARSWQEWVDRARGSRQVQITGRGSHLDRRGRAHQHARRRAHDLTGHGHHRRAHLLREPCRARGAQDERPAAPLGQGCAR